jgi:hypothetical protein
MEAGSGEIPAKRKSRYNAFFEKYSKAEPVEASKTKHIQTFKFDFKAKREEWQQEQARQKILDERMIGNAIRREAGPSLTKMAGNFIGAMGAYAKDGFRNVNKEEHAVRQAICNGCEFWDAKARMGAGKCMKCGCSGAKLWMASSECPIKKWGKIPTGVLAETLVETPQA